MSNPGPPDEDQRPPAGPDAGMGLPESGTQHATSTDFALPLDRTARPEPMAAGSAAGQAPPPARPTPPAYDDPSELVLPPPADDEPPDLLEAVPDVEATGLATSHAGAGTPVYGALAAETGFTQPVTTTPGADAGALAKVKAFAERRPAAFLGLALLAGWLVGKLFSSTDDED